MSDENFPDEVIRSIAVCIAFLSVESKYESVGQVSRQELTVKSMSDNVEERIEKAKIIEKYIKDGN